MATTEHHSLYTDYVSSSTNNITMYRPLPGLLCTRNSSSSAATISASASASLAFDTPQSTHSNPSSNSNAISSSKASTIAEATTGNSGRDTDYRLPYGERNLSSSASINWKKRAAFENFKTPAEYTNCTKQQYLSSSVARDKFKFGGEDREDDEADMDRDDDEDCDSELEGEAEGETCQAGSASRMHLPTAVNRPAGCGETTIVRRHRRKPPPGVQLTCRVCGDDACGYNFDALTCHSCKLFFRRNAYRTLTCPFTGNCQMDRRSRKFCASCRLNKCFSVGMLRELIKLRYVQKNYHQKSLTSNISGVSQAPRSRSPRLTPPDTPDSADRAGAAPSSPQMAMSLKFSASGPTSSTRINEVNGDSALSGAKELKRAYPYGFVEPPSAPKRASMGYGEASLPFDAQSHNQVAAQTFIDALRNMLASSFDPSAMAASSSAIGEFGSPLSVSSAFSCSTPSSCMPSSVGTRCSSTIMPRTRSVLSEYEYDNILMQCHAYWQSVSANMVDSDVFSQIVVKPIHPNQIQCGSTTVSLHLTSGNYVCTYFELGIRRAIAALRLMNDFADLSPEGQMKLLKAGLLSVLNVMSISSYDTASNSWTIRVSREHSRRFSPFDAITEAPNVAFRGFLERLGSFHSSLRQRFADDYVPLVSMSIIQLFDPARFTSESSSFVAQIRRIQRKYVNFLRKYIHRHYRSSGANGDKSAEMELSDDIDPEILLRQAAEGRLDEECRAHVLLRFCIDQLATTVRGLEQLAQQISTQLLVPQVAAGQLSNQ